VAHSVNGKGRLEYPIGRVLYESSNRVESPRISPHGDQVVFADHPLEAETVGSVMVVDRSGPARPLSSDWFDVFSPVWSPDAREIWFSASRTGARRSLWAVTLSGRLRPLAETPGSSMILDASPAGKVLINHESWRAFISGVPPGESAERDFTWLDFSFPTDLSDDGKTLLFQEWGEGGGTKGSVYLRRMDGSPPLRLGEGFGFSLSPDGQWVIARLYTRPPRLVLLPTGAGEPKPLSTEGILVQGAAWFPDGKRILLLGSTPDRKVSYYALDVGGGKARPIAPAEGVSFFLRALISPDGRWLPHVGKDRRLVLLPLDGGEQRPVAGAEPGEFPIRWTADGRFLFVERADGARRMISRVDPITGRREAWKEILVSTDTVGLRTDAVPILLSADGKSCFWGYQRYSDELYLVEGLK
jgi:Tol biopolymer transport system component